MQPNSLGRKELILFDLLKYFYVKYGVDFLEDIRENERQSNMNDDVWDRTAIKHGYPDFQNYLDIEDMDDWVRYCSWLGWVKYTENTPIITEKFIDLLETQNV